MFVSAINCSNATKNFKKCLTINTPLKTSTQNDVFVKTNQINFGNSINAKQAEKNKFLDKLTTMGIVGAPFLLSVAAATYVAKKQNPSDIFLPDGTYFANTDELQIKSDKLSFDAISGDFSVKNTGINIKADEYDVVDVSKGIYRNYDNSVDIDLLNNKYIDVENGIFIDPENNISAIKANDEIINIIIPAFKGSSLSGGNFPYYSFNFPDSMDQLREMVENEERPSGIFSALGGIVNVSQEDLDALGELAKNPNYRPEDLAHFKEVVLSLDNLGILEKQYKQMDYIQEIINSEKSILERVKDFFVEPAEVANSSKYDILGRKIFTFKDDDNNLVTFALNPEISEKLEKYNLDDNKISKVNEFLENIRLKQYVTNVAPEYSVFLKPHANSVAEFIEGLSSGQNSSFLTPEAIVTAEAAFSNFTDVVEQNSDNINDISDAIEQNLENLQEAKETLFDIIKSYFGA